MAQQVGIVTDTISCLPPELAREYDIRVVPTGLVIDGRAYRDCELSNEEFWQLFYAAREQPTTSAVTPGEFATVFSDLARTTDSIVCITVSAALSATHATALRAADIVREQHPGLKIEVVDSRTATGAEGFIVLEAARAARAGGSLEAVARAARDAVPRVKFVTALDTLKYLIKSGRAPRTAVLGNVLQVKPIIGMLNNTGLVESVARARGSQKAMVRMAEIVREQVGPGKPVRLMFHYTDGIGPAEALKALVMPGLNVEEVYLTPYTPVMASQTGPVVAVSFYV